MPDTSHPTPASLNALLTFFCSRVIFKPRATNSVEFVCVQMAGMCANALVILTEKSDSLVPCPVATIAAAALVGTAVRPRIQPLVRPSGVGDDGVDAHEDGLA